VRAARPQGTPPPPGCDVLHEASELDLHDAARGVAALQADVTLDLSGFASKRAVHVLSARPAHVQAALFSAFPFSAGAPAFAHALFGDRVRLPARPPARPPAAPPPGNEQAV
jgi:predicted O-linked N-acetylglucosamine transferase (SPINDLY family)